MNPEEDQPKNALDVLAEMVSDTTSKVPRVSVPTRTLKPEAQNVSSETSTSSTPTDSAPKKSGFLRFADLEADSGPQPVLENKAESEQVADGSDKEESQPGSTTDKMRVASPGQLHRTTGLLSAFATLSQNGENTGMLKLTEPVKIVQVPVEGQPGRFITGFLPVVTAQPPVEQVAKPLWTRLTKRAKIASLLLALVQIIGTSVTIYFAWSAYSHHGSVQKTQKLAVNPSTNATAQAMATAQGNIILADDLSQNIHNWPIGQQGSFTYTFRDEAYHITNNNKDESAPALLSGMTVNGPFTYSLTMEQIKGDETSANNQFGMILYASVQNSGGKQIDKFYAFEVVNKAGGEYQFWKYDNSQTSDTSPWTKLWTQSFGKEFLQGSGSSYANKFKIVATGKMFTFFVNGKQVGSFKDRTFSSGNVGMLVNLDGAEVAFSNLLLTYS